MLLQIITPEKMEWTGEADKVTLPAFSGQITVLPGHTDMITGVSAGEVEVYKGDKQINLFISEGSAQITHDEITVLVDIATEAKDISAAQVLEAKTAALKAKENKLDTMNFAEIESNLKRELAKEKILQKYHKKIKTV
jgi:F-type H+-transporting ATPase subunit epsilon